SSHLRIRNDRGASSFFIPLKVGIICLVSMRGRVAHKASLSFVKENCLTNLQNVLAPVTAIWYFPAL
ncbi:MAG: hypothetical protein ACDS79_18740, partial [Enterobacteriaceae bacterium]